MIDGLLLNKVQLDVFTNSFNINYNEIAIGVLRIQNIGNSTALHLRLNMNWTQFTTQDFNLNAGQYNLINFNITPQITKTADTNKTYSLIMTLTGDNIETKTEVVNIFVNYHDFRDTQQNNTNTTNIVYIVNDEVIRDYCSRNPDLCPKTNVTEIIYLEKPTQLNITQSDWSTLISDINANRDFRLEIKSFMAQLQDRQNRLEENIKNLTEDLNSNTKAVKGIEEKFQKLKINSFWWKVILTIIILILGLIGLGVYFILKWKSEQDSYVGL